MSQNVSSVKTVCFSINKSNPPQLSVSASGAVNSSGWNGGALLPRVYVLPPQDGIQDFDFVAEAPTGIVLWKKSAISGDGGVVLESWMKGARVHAATNSITVLLTDSACAVGQGTLADYHLDASAFNTQQLKVKGNELGEHSTEPGAIHGGPRGPKGG